jgi:hypothetical protein
MQKLDLKKTDEHKWRESKRGGGKKGENIIKECCVHYENVIMKPMKITKKK